MLSQCLANAQKVIKNFQERKKVQLHRTQSLSEFLPKTFEFLVFAQKRFF